MNAEKKTLTDHCHGTGTIDDQPCPGCDECEVIDLDEDDGPCWCGVENPHYEDLPDRCGGDGVIHCECGGDFCVCHWHGGVECLGCPDCDDRNDDDDFDDDDEHEWNEDLENWECEP